MRFPLLSKALTVGAVMFLLMLVLMRIEGLVHERRWRQTQAVQSVEQSLAGAQTLMGPLLHRSCTEEWDIDKGEGRERRTVTERREFTLTAPPHTLVVTGDVRAEARYRGLFKVNGYAGAAEFEARWADLSALRPERQRADSRLTCSPARMMVAVSDVRGLQSARLKVDGQGLAVQAGTQHPRHPRGLHAELPASRLAADREPLVVQLAVELAGTARLALVPAAGETSWTLRSDWPHPSFGGRFLPASREVNEAGFKARWAVSSLASSAAAEVQRQGQVCPQVDPDPETGLAPAPANGCLETLAVSFIDPVNPYVLTDRATKYALLFIVLTFAFVALVEVLARRRVHPIQYTLVGLALALFFLLLLSLSEHLPFGTAYAAAAAACVALLAHYAAHMLGSRRAGAGFGAGVALLYGLLWALLRLEQTALAIGSVMLFAALAAIMVATRRVDWYALVDGWRRDGAAVR